MSLPLLLEHLKKTAALSQVSGLISWDQETTMPPKGAAQRAEQSGAMASIIHAQNADPRIPEWIAKIEDKDALSRFDKTNIDQAQRSYDHATKIPARLAEESAKAASAGQITWAQAREKKDFAHFAPALTNLVELKREEAKCLSAAGDPYDALLDQFEPGATIKTLLPMLESLREPLVNLREKIADKPTLPELQGTFSPEGQMQLAERVAAKLGYDFEAGRLDLSNHPFSSGTGDDCRITTRVDEQNPVDCLYSTIHEVGHALYSQGLSDPFLPAADYCSMGVHESQSRFWENQIARSKPFCEWLLPIMRETFPTMDIKDPDVLYKTINRVETGFIRTEADEVHYNLHVLLRFQLERQLIDGSLEVADLESAWNELFQTYFGLKVINVNQGVLQDIHWSVGLFGYFPTYSLGNIYSACLDQSMRKDMPERDAKIAKGENGQVLSWLREKIHHQGRMFAAPALIEQACDAPPTAQPLITYLKTKYSDIYDL